MPVRLSVNVNKVATLRNSRGAQFPDPVDAAKVCIEAGAPGITVHPRADERHIRPADVRAIADLLEGHPEVEYNIEGDVRSDFIELVLAVRPHQCTLVPVLENEITSQGGWPADTDENRLRETVGELKRAGIRVSLFVEARVDAIEWASRFEPDRVELYTEPFADAFKAGNSQAVFAQFVEAALHAHNLGLGVNAGHDLDLDNLVVFRELPCLDEVSIGHALIGAALFSGLAPIVKRYLEVLSKAA